MAQLNKMAFCPKICYFIRKCAIRMTWLQIKIAILLHIHLKCSSKWNFATKILQKSSQTLNVFHKPWIKWMLPGSKEATRIPALCNRIVVFTNNKDVSLEQIYIHLIIQMVALEVHNQHVDRHSTFLLQHPGEKILLMMNRYPFLQHCYHHLYAQLLPKISHLLFSVLFGSFYAVYKNK